MPQNKFAIARYRIIDALLRKHDFVKTSLMVEQCCRKTGYNVSRRTIELDIAAMRYDEFLGYLAPIAYDAHRKAYFYEEPFPPASCFFSACDAALLREIYGLCQSLIPEHELHRLEKITAIVEHLSE